ncbi:MAG TPA: bacterial transcriptional activator domain-containing protein [Thermoanaerobaculia bacterium]|jgi:tetratricopeptide (TPR) repeat protein|nr:bacterial transcriptional activator domain-containing protein [Thermoanaerobaculia bacterium]
MSRLARSLVAALVITFAAAPLLAAELGEVSFANSGAAAAQPAFLRGLALLHDFEYEDAADSFQQAQKLDPGFAMACWGEAMTHTHPVWMQQDLEAARAALGKLAPTPAERAAKAPTERERDYLHTVEVLYGEGSKEQRDLDYAAAMAALHEKYPQDVDAAAFYALALLGTAHHGRDFATYMRAAAVLEDVFPAHPRHPGVLHYLIHCYDDSVHAPLGLRAARLYGAVAPDAGHALHMTSHIFVALGQWDDVITANERAMQVVDAQRHAKGEPPARCGHYASWLHYAFLQAGRTADARRVMDGCHEEALGELRAAAKDASYDGVDSYAEMRLRHFVDSGTLADGALKLPESGMAATRLSLAYADALAAAGKGGSPAKAREAAERLHAAASVVAAAAGSAGSGAATLGATADVMDRQIAALVSIREGKRDEGLVALAIAADKEDALPLSFGPPEVDKPSRELLGEELLAAGRAAEAKEALQTALARTPGRTAVLRALLQAQKALGDDAEAARTEAALARNLSHEGAAGAPR